MPAPYCICSNPSCRKPACVSPHDSKLATCHYCGRDTVVEHSIGVKTHRPPNASELKWLEARQAKLAAEAAKRKRPPS